MKKKTLSEIIIDSPSLGYLTIFLASEDTEIDVESYYVAVQLQYTPERKIELNLKDNSTNQYTNKIKITQDIIRG
ncbi:MAG: hypothetical protein EHM25_11985 [Nitrosopumilales archaeon]|nr:MAG: hypothetical protein EHM25_11985 [Nitrosopumilales archaeon]